VKFDPKPYTIVKSIAQRGLLSWWNRPGRRNKLPSRTEAEGEELARLAQDLALYEVQHHDGGLRYKCLRHGEGLRPIDGADLTGRYLDEFFPDPIREGALAAYDATVTMACPIYTLRNAIDAQQVPVTFERLRLPLSHDGARIDHVITHVEIFCEEGRYQRDNLLKAGVAMHDYVVTAAISFGAIGLSPGAEVLES
jgi:hypothetical protein